MLWLTLVLAAVVGVLLGLLGGGGSILMVPLLAYVAGMEGRVAIASSLFVVAVTSVAALVPHARAGRVQWRTGVVFGVGAMAGAYAGGRLAEHVPTAALMGGFAVMMLVTANAMILGRRDLAPTRRELAVGRAVGLGALVGLLTGTVGAGGGFIVVPALVMLAGLPMADAVATSLLVIALNSTAGLAGHLAATSIPWPTVLAVTALSVLGSLVGGRLTGLVPQDRLRRGFGWFVLLMGALVLGQTLLSS